MVVLQQLPRKNLVPSLQFGLWHHGLRLRCAAFWGGWEGPSWKVKRGKGKRKEEDKYVMEGGATRWDE